MGGVARGLEAHGASLPHILGQPGMSLCRTYVEVQTQLITAFVKLHFCAGFVVVVVFCSRQLPRGLSVLATVEHGLQKNAYEAFQATFSHTHSHRCGG